MIILIFEQISNKRELNLYVQKKQIEAGECYCFTTKFVIKYYLS